MSESDVKLTSDMKFNGFIVETPGGTLHGPFKDAAEAEQWMGKWWGLISPPPLVIKPLLLPVTGRK